MIDSGDIELDSQLISTNFIGNFAGNLVSKWPANHQTATFSKICVMFTNLIKILPFF